MSDQIILYPAPSAEGGGAASYLVYTALLTQSGTDAPVATVLENTVGAIVWTRTGEGAYLATLAGAFPVGKCFPVSAEFYISIGNEDVAQLSRNSADSYQLNTAEAGTPLDDLLSNFPVEIRVYP